MGRLFDSAGEEKQASAVLEARKEASRRAHEADEALRDFAESDEAAERLKATLSQRQTVSPVRYEEYRRPGTKWMIEHSQVGEDYILQLHPLRPPTIEWQDVIAFSIAAMDAIFPRSLKIQYVPPSLQYKLQFFTIKVNNLAGLPGWSSAIQRALVSLSAIDAWIKPLPS